MKTACVLLAIALAHGAYGDDWTAVIAAEGAIVTLEAGTQPLPAPKPDEPLGTAGLPVTGPLDTLRDAKDLIHKGNQLVDRSQALLDQAQRDGKITVDIRLPKTATPASPPTCRGGVCPLISAPALAPAEPSVPKPGDGCPDGGCRRRAFWRFRR